MDYQHLLKRYMQYVIDVEGVSFVSAGSYNSQVELTKAEAEELAKIEMEIIASENPIAAEDNNWPEAKEDQGYKGDLHSQEE